MKALIDPLKRIVRDLVDKKLWPVAVLLLAAIAAVPVLIGGSSSSQAPAPVAVAATAPDGASKSLVTVVDEASAAKATRPGRIQDPFYDPPEPPAAKTASGGSPAASPQARKQGGAPAAGTPRTGKPLQTAPQQPSERVAAPVHHRTVVRWYAAKPGMSRPLARLTPLGGLVDPALLYLGVTRSKGAYAVFLLGPNATSDGEAACEDDTDCRVIGLKSGQSQLVTVQPPDGGEARQYHLEVVSVKAVATDAATARTMRAKVHADGRDVMREIWQDRPTADALRPIRYDRDTGLLVKTATPAAAAAKDSE